MTRLHFDIRIERNLISQIDSRMKNTVKSSIRTIAQDLARTASETAPHKSGDLEGSYAIEYSMSGNDMYATVEFSVMNGGLNYAVAMHEWTYNLGEGSRRKGGGTGMSGKTYPVGRKYLTRVLEGESEAYTQYISDKINQLLGGN